MEIPAPIFLLRDLYPGQETTVRTRYRRIGGLKLGEKKSIILSPCLFNLYAEHILENAGLEETQAQIKRKIEISIEISMTSDTQMISPTWHKAKNIERASGCRRNRRVKKLA